MMLPAFLGPSVHVLKTSDHTWPHKIMWPITSVRVCERQPNRQGDRLAIPGANTQSAVTQGHEHMSVPLKHRSSPGPLSQIPSPDGVSTTSTYSSHGSGFRTLRGTGTWRKCSRGFQCLPMFYKLVMFLEMLNTQGINRYQGPSSYLKNQVDFFLIHVWDKGMWWSPVQHCDTHFKMSTWS